MPPTIHLIRHAQGEHNATRNYEIRDAVLTPKGKEQCRILKSKFSHHDDVNIIFASPLRRTIQTAALSLGPALSRQDVPFVLLPSLQEVSATGCDTGMADSAEDVKRLLPELFAQDELDFDYNKIDASAVTEGWNSKQGYWAYQKEAISKRAADLRNWFFQRPEEQIVVVTHGAFAHFLTEDWDVDDPMTGTAYKNCEHREFVFTADSTAEDAHVTETRQSRTSRGAQEIESDPHVLDELKTVEGVKG
ncbi:phosphoglycerate mutase-like protein [Cucurbitaria berberidis CBS 394.84]|uniref:Phosphoglycerate mutase-like protein n=1 Tax=Cucurbitaria berberidis CBS 394.84 TaxID=1168544 RepID=A0A9P4GFB9_9PLEO|nr:phosphoglycerate mutase-like protein [Cucurbitaria berberidis CBS 394.84]KAF1845013.1 phosphoglycerate mutase-like protein [Cucurbitaria berberidis CBS 394.84]